MVDEALHLQEREPAPGKKAAAVLAVLMHVLLAAFLIYGIRWQTNTPEAVEVELVGARPNTAPPPSPAPVKEPTPEPQPVKEPPKPPVQEKPVTPPKPPDIAIKDKPKPKEEPPKPKAEPPKPKAEPKPVEDPMKALLDKETQQQRRAQQKNDMDALLAKEANASKAQSAQAGARKAMADYIGKIKGKIKGRIVQPPSIAGSTSPQFEVTQLPDGSVVTVKMLKSSGLPALDRAIESAIHMSSPLPLPDRPELFDRTLILTWRPDEFQGN